MSQPNLSLLIIYDDRETVVGDVRTLVGPRRFGDITIKRQALSGHFTRALPQWARERLVHLRSNDDLPALRVALEASGENSSVCIVASRAGFLAPEHLTQLIERLPYAEEDFTDSLYRPLLVFLRNAHALIRRWADFTAAPLHEWEQVWQDRQRVRSVQALDLAKIRDFLSFASGSTATRHFNEVQMDAYYYTKRSSDKRKMLAEYSFYGLVPEAMRPWLIQPFDYRDEGEQASYRMLRYYLADASLQWVHGAFEADTFAPFIDRLLFFIAERPKQACSKEQSLALARKLFLGKLEERVAQFLAHPEGQRINQLASCATPEVEITRQLERYRSLFQRNEKGFVFDHNVVGHGDPCFSNILYDQTRYLLKLIDPKGAVTEDEIWTHPLYDLCKISHSVMGDYDFINSGLYRVGFSDNNNLVQSFEHTNHAALKTLFLQSIKAAGHDARIMRLGEASLFLSMLPLHLDHPNKVIAFMLKAKQILDEVEHGPRL